MSKVLILGSNGLLGSRLGNYLKNFDGTFFQIEPHGSGKYHYLDVTEPSQFRNLIEFVKPEIVINCTGYTDVEECEKFPEKCWSINCTSVVAIAEICKSRAIKFIQISTDHFIQSESKKMTENLIVFPANQYSFAKLNAETMIRTINPGSLIIRTNFFQINVNKPRTFLEKMIVSIKSGREVSSFRDVIFSPISINQLISCILELINIDYFGTINICSTDSISKFDFHDMVLQALNLDTSLHSPVSIDDFLHLAQRPKNMALDSSKFMYLTNHKIPSIYDMINEEIAIGCQDTE
jgi:dTDP-4-dehydrorhamnose reductase